MYIMARLIFLQGGEDVKKRTNFHMFKEILNISKKKNILVIPWTTESKKKEKFYRNVYINYFKEVGFKKIIFLELSDSFNNAQKKFSKVDVVYIPGGDPSILYKRIIKRKIDRLIKSFRGILIGNSAGAILLSRGQIEEDKVYPGIGLLDFFVKVHYKPTESKIKKGKNEKITVCIPENLWIVINLPY